MARAKGKVSEAGSKKRKMNKRDLNKFAKRLEEEKARLVEELSELEETVLNRSLRESSGDLSGYSLHTADVGTDAEERETAFQYATDQARLLNEVVDALRKIETGEYGICEICEKPIEKVRLEALPYARLCLKCQAKSEHSPI
jgi:RNA polymerase-binding protein DksA